MENTPMLNRLELLAEIHHIARRRDGVYENMGWHEDVYRLLTGHGVCGGRLGRRRRRAVLTTLNNKVLMFQTEQARRHKALDELVRLGQEIDADRSSTGRAPAL